ncbi:MAG TPA: hypothetical protein VEC56_09625 [Candidatus Krumholzibacteria bacterium]|nr:hypothetical protein [Candidatus Krumholzibacteria bacterium]
MRKHGLKAIAIAAVLLSGWLGAANAESSIGGGVHYLRNLGDIQTYGYEENSFSLMASYQFAGPLLKFEADLEYVFDFAGTGEAMWEPQAYALVGGMIYGGAGIGIGYLDGDWQNDPFYALRAGVNLPLGGFNLDMFASYRFQSDEELENLTGDDLDSMTFGALMRFGL